uniref:C-type lectin domain-containing protein n=1 Tax=Cyprinus carpio TaxID=7962 RepID=A0A8C2FDU8_CYPCA
MEYVHEVHIFIHFTKFKLEPSIKKVFHKCNSVLLDLCCPDGWMLFSSHCYYFSDDGMPWDAARDECKKKRSELLILKSKQEKVRADPYCTTKPKQLN